MGMAVAELVPVSLSPLQPPLHAAAQPGHGREAELPALLQNQVLLTSSEVLPLVQKLRDLANSDRQEPGAVLPWEHAEAKPGRAKPMGTHPKSHSGAAGVPNTAPSLQGHPASYLRWWWRKGRQPR